MSKIKIPKKRGRPHAPASRALSAVVQIRFKESQYLKIQEEAEKNEQEISSFLRQKIKECLKMAK